jgi:hypothetical protein
MTGLSQHRAAAPSKGIVSLLLVLLSLLRIGGSVI